MGVGNKKILIIGCGTTDFGVTTLTEQDLTFTQTDMKHESNVYRITTREPMVEMDYIPEPKRRKNRKKVNNNFGESKFF